MTRSYGSEAEAISFMTSVGYRWETVRRWLNRRVHQDGNVYVTDQSPLASHLGKTQILKTKDGEKDWRTIAKVIRAGARFKVHVLVAGQSMDGGGYLYCSE